MELAMANEFSAVGFTELNENEMMWIDGGDLFPTLMKACEFLFVGAVSASFGTLGTYVGTAIGGIGGSTGGPVGTLSGAAVGGAIGCIAGGYVGSLVGQGLWDLMFE